MSTLNTSTAAPETTLPAPSPGEREKEAVTA